MNSNTTQDIRGVLIGVTGSRLLLPNASVAEVITYSPPEPEANAPNWMLGRIRWRGWRLPLISYARMIGYVDHEGEYGAKVVVLKALGGNPRNSYFALLAQGFPRLITVAKDALEINEEFVGGGVDNPVLMKVNLREDHALIPNLALIEAKIDALESNRAA